MASAPATLAFFLMPPNQPLQLMFKLQKALCYTEVAPEGPWTGKEVGGGKCNWSWNVTGKGMCAGSLVGQWPSVARHRPE